MLDRLTENFFYPLQFISFVFDEDNLKGWIRDEVRSLTPMNYLPLVCISLLIFVFYWVIAVAI